MSAPLAFAFGMYAGGAIVLLTFAIHSAHRRIWAAARAGEVGADEQKETRG